MLSLVGILVLGFLLGIRHATDPDHVIAVTTIVSRQRGIAKAGLIGALWGLGHTFTIFVVGAAIILFKVAIPARVGLSMELAVGLMLILLGVLNVTGMLRLLQAKFMVSNLIASLPTVRDGSHQSQTDVSESSGRDSKENATPKSWLNNNLRAMGPYNVFRPLVIGIVHGLAGSAAVALLVMTTIHDPWWAIAYLLVFGIGTIAGMMLITMAISAPFAYTGKRFVLFHQGVGVASGLISLSFGLFLTYQTGFVSGFFTVNPHWTPH